MLQQFPLEEYPQINTERLVIRKFQESDIPGFFLLRSNPEVMRYIPRPLAKSYKDIEDFIQISYDSFEKGEHANFAIELKDTNEFIGSIGYYRINYEASRTEIGYILSPEHQGNGYIHEAMNAIIDFGFNVMGFHSLEAIIDPRNDASVKVVEKVGFIREGHFKENGYFNGEYIDSYVFSLLNKND